MNESSRSSASRGEIRRRLVRHSAIPEPTQLEISGELANYSVALGRVQGEDSTTFQLIGSGVCVIRNGIFGILTSHHCLHAAEPEVILGKLSTENLVFMVKRGRIIRERGAFLVEHELGSPPKKGRYTPSGPDLTFVEIPAGPTLASFRAMASFFNLDRNSVAVSPLVFPSSAGPPFATSTPASP